MCCFAIPLLFNDMQMSVRRFSAIPHLKRRTHGNLGFRKQLNEVNELHYMNLGTILNFS